VAGVYDHLLGGTDHSATHQAAGDQIMAALPEAGVGVRAQRDVLRRAVRYLAAEAGVGQFADLGSGLPTELTAAWYRSLAPGSYVFIHHLLTSEDPTASGLQAAMAQALGPVQFRTRPEVEALFGGLELIEPGVVPVPQWHPDPDTPSERDHPVLGLACAGLAVVR
jgi:hypothetical protein